MTARSMEVQVPCAAQLIPNLSIQSTYTYLPDISPPYFPNKHR